jgi:hypothetical protein
MDRKSLFGVAALSLAAFALNKHRIAGVYGAVHPEFRYQPSAPPGKLGDVGWLRWVSSRPDFAPSYAGMISFAFIASPLTAGLLGQE